MQCTTCNARLSVRNRRAIGQILPCPKCGSMVMIEAPEDDLDTLDDVQPPAHESQTDLPPSGEIQESERWKHDEHAPVLPTGDWESTGTQQRRRRLIIIAATIAVLLLGITGVAAWLRSGGQSEASLADAADTTSDDAAESPSKETPGNDSSPQEETNPDSDATATTDTGSTPQESPATQETGDVDANATSSNEVDGGNSPPQTGQLSERPIDEQASLDNQPGEIANPPGDSDPAIGDDDKGVAASEALSNQPPGLTPAADSDNTTAPDTKSALQQLDEIISVLDQSPAAAATAEFPTVARTPLPQIDVAARLEMKLDEFEIENGRLVDLASSIYELTGVPVTLDTNQLAGAGIAPDVSLSAKLTDCSVASVLEEALRPHGIVPRIEPGQMVLGAVPPELVTLRYAVESFPGDAADTRAVANLVSELVQPGSWANQSGQGTLTFDGPQVIVTQSVAAHAELQQLLAAVQLRRSPPVEPSLPPDAASSLTVNFLTPTPLFEVLRAVAEQARLPIYIDWRQAASEYCAPGTQVELQSNGQSLAETLANLLAESNLGFVIVDGQRVEIRSASAPGLGVIGTTSLSDQELQQLKERLAQAGNAATVHWDPHSRCLLIRGDATQRAMVVNWLESLQEPPQPPGVALPDTPTVPRNSQNDRENANDS